MRSFEIHPDVADMFPSMLVCFVVASGVRNDEPWPAVEEDLATLERAAADGSWTIESQATGTNSWHEAYRRFGTNPKRMRPSMEALARRLDRKHELPRISGAVDSYTASPGPFTSSRYALNWRGTFFSYVSAPLHGGVAQQVVV